MRLGFATGPNWAISLTCVWLLTGATPILSCSPVSGSVANGNDCDDTNAAIHPGSIEVCDSAMLDENCNGTANEGCL